ncbi:MAG TPA: DsbE family thiol:disulfide interchange protein [Stellaceae bacterium]|jgi:cytochrome c biogenesis protein CcmG/thiol:disulfide interchange protein DsbE|nr:DsbE family thiol:disulfide interchange protein [Stellaceae bacterium]
MSWRRALYLLPLVLFAALAVYLFQGVAPGRDPQLLPSAMIDKPAPDFALPELLGGGQLTLADMKGQVVLVNFFASWCVPCRAEHPVLMTLSHDLAVPLYGIAYKDKPEDSAKFLAELGNPFRRTGLDQNGRTGIDFGVYGVPETYAIDRDGRIRWRHVGPLDQAAIDHELMPLLHRLGVP